MKYRTCARQGGVEEPPLSRMLAMLTRIEEIADVRELTELLVVIFRSVMPVKTGMTGAKANFSGKIN